MEAEPAFPELIQMTVLMNCCFILASPTYLYAVIYYDQEVREQAILNNIIFKVIKDGASTNKN